MLRGRAARIPASRAAVSATLRRVTPLAALRRLARIHASYPDAAAEKRTVLALLERGRLPSARAVRRLHDLLCFLRAYPDDAAMLEQVERMLAAFERRSDLRRHRRALENSGIAGTVLSFSFFGATARRLARSWPNRLSLDWSSFDPDRLGRWLPILGLPAERAAFDDPSLRPRDWARRFAGGTDAAFVLRSWDALPMDDLARDAVYDDLDPLLRLAPGPDTPCRTREKHRSLPVAFQTRALSRQRPELKSELRRPVSVRDAAPAEGRELLELARNTMLPRERDLEVFAYGNARDVRIVDAGDGLVFACIGVVPARRSLLEAVYAFTLLQNGVAIGYALCSALFRSSEVAFNVFDTYRGGESGRIFGRLLAAIHQLFGSDTFAIDPYQLGGQGNAEGLSSGAFWFYQKLGFRPHDGEVLAAMEAELRRMKARPRHRSSRSTLKVLSSRHVFWHAGKPRDDVLGALDLQAVARHVSAYVARRFGGDRARAARECLREASRLLGLGGLRGDERRALESWAPLVLSVPGIDRWPVSDRRALARVIRAKGAVRESDFVPLFDRHARLRRALRSLATPRRG
jgi:hypothetical protein